MFDVLQNVHDGAGDFDRPFATSFSFLALKSNCI